MCVLVDRIFWRSSQPSSFFTTPPENFPPPPPLDVTDRDLRRSLVVLLLPPSQHTTDPERERWTNVTFFGTCDYTLCEISEKIPSFLEQHQTPRWGTSAARKVKNSLLLLLLHSFSCRMEKKWERRVQFSSPSRQESFFFVFFFFLRAVIQRKTSFVKSRNSIPQDAPIGGIFFSVKNKRWSGVPHEPRYEKANPSVEQ